MCWRCSGGELVEASWCSCERLFSYVTATGHGHSMERMCETLWVKYNGEAPKDWCPFEVFEELRTTPFCPRKQMQEHHVEVEDGGLLRCAALKDLEVSLEQGAEVEVPLNIQDMRVVAKSATRDSNIEHVYVAALEDEDEDSEDEDLDQLVEVASSSSSDPLTQLALSPPVTQAASSNSSNPAPQLVFKCDGDEAVLRAIERGRLHKWTIVEFRAICRKHDLSVRGGESEPIERVKVHFQGLASP